LRGFGIFVLKVLRGRSDCGRFWKVSLLEKAGEGVSCTKVEDILEIGSKSYRLFKCSSQRVKVLMPAKMPLKVSHSWRISIGKSTSM
jgi:hypothetical protein